MYDSFFSKLYRDSKRRAPIIFNPINNDKNCQKRFKKINSNLCTRITRLKWDEVKEDSLEILKELRSLKSGWENFIPHSKNLTLNMEFIIFFEKMKVWSKYIEDHNLEFIQTPKELIINSLSKGPEWALAQKKVFDYSIRQTLSKTFINAPPDVQVYELKDINQLFPSRSYIPFEIPEDLSDARFSLEDPPKITENIDKLKSVMKKFIKKNQILRNFTVLDWLNLSNSKKVRQKDQLYDKSFSFEERSNHFDLSIKEKEKHIFNISFTSKDSDQGRVIAIPDIPLRNLYYLVRLSVEQLTNCPSDYYGKKTYDSFEFRKFIQQEDNTFFLMCDQSKSGWTFPQELMLAFFEVLTELYPNYPPFEEMKRVYKEKDIYFVFPEGLKQTKRGFVLGMHDNIMSFIISCMFEMMKKDLTSQYDFLENNIFAKMFGDDQLIKITNTNFVNVMTIWNHWLKLIIGYGINVNLKKSFVSNYGILCETYTLNGDINLKKDVLWLQILYNSLRGVNTTHRKYLYSQNYDWISSYLGEDSPFGDPTKWMRDSVMESLTLIRQIIGREFDEEEDNLPIELGGWHIFRNEKGQNLLIDLIMSRNFPDRYKWVALVKKDTYYSKESLKRLEGYKKSTYLSSLFEKCNFLFDNGNEFLNKIKKLPFGFKNVTKFEENKWHEFSKKRREAFNKKEKCYTKLYDYFYYINDSYKECSLKKEYLRPNDNVLYLVKQEVKPIISGLTKELASLLFYQEMNYENFEIEIYNRKYISCKDVVRTIMKDISQNSISIPIEWYSYCVRHSLNFMELRRTFLEDQEDLLERYLPPFYMKEDNLTKNFGTEATELYWDEDFGNIIPLKSGLNLIGFSDIFDKSVKAGLMNLTFGEYDLKATMRSLKEEIPEEDIKEEDSQEESDPSFNINIDFDIERKIDEQFEELFTKDLVMDFTPHSENEEEEEESSSSDDTDSDSDESEDELQGDEDLLGFDLLENLEQDNVVLFEGKDKE